jgi:hypothetical protein
MTQADVERRIRQIVWPAPSQDLRLRVLAAAAVRHERVTWSDRIWFSRGWRFAGAAATIAAIAVASWNSTDRHTVVVTGEARAGAQAVSDVGRALGMPVDLSASLVQRTLAAPRMLASGVRKRALLDELATGERR